MINHNNQRGFTLVELVIGMAVMALVMAAVFGVLSSSVNVQSFGVNQEASFNQIRSVLNTISEELRYSTVTAPAAGVTANEISYTTRDGETRRIYRGTIGVETNMIVITRPGGNLLLGNGLIQAPTFTCAAAPNDDRIITITLTATSGTGATAATITLSTNVRTGTI